jgi:hypothetical protein
MHSLSCLFFFSSWRKVKLFYRRVSFFLILSGHHHEKSTNRTFSSSPAHLMSNQHDSLVKPITAGLKFFVAYNVGAPTLFRFYRRTKFYSADFYFSFPSGILRIKLTNGRLSLCKPGCNPVVSVSHWSEFQLCMVHIK